MHAISVERLTKCYGRRAGVQDLGFQVPEGVMFGFLGPNGSGKTTTIRVLLGLLRADQGRAQVMGRDCWKRSREAMVEIGYVPGDLRLYPWLTCRSALRIIGLARRRDLSNPGCKLAEEFDLPMEVPVRRMSRGMRQKLGLIMALAPQPRLLLLDEPSTGLDPLVQDRFFAHLRGLVRAGHTVFFSSHVLSEVEDLCDRVAIMRHGRLAACESLETLRQRAHRRVSILWHAGTNLSAMKPPSMLGDVSNDGLRWSATLQGDSGELLVWCRDKPIADLTIGVPDLSEIFRRYYEGDESKP